jgi:hypothetical protein
MVLGNHDLHLLAVAAGVRKPGRSDTLDASSRLRTGTSCWPGCSTSHCCTGNGFTLVHAGIPPQWTVAEAKAGPDEVEGPARTGGRSFFADMYGNEPDCLVAGPDRHGTPAGHHQLLHAHALLRRRRSPRPGQQGPAGPRPAVRRPMTPLDAWFRHPERKRRRRAHHLRPLGLAARAHRRQQRHRPGHGLRLGQCHDALLPGDRRAHRQPCGCSPMMPRRRSRTRVRSQAHLDPRARSRSRQPVES